jgi:hypothetical protein
LSNLALGSLIQRETLTWPEAAKLSQDHNESDKPKNLARSVSNGSVLTSTYSEGSQEDVMDFLS